jgi:predicted metal-dependent hydrolase
MCLPPEDQEHLRQGLEYFRAGDYFAAHDAWEEVWQGLHGRRRLFWQAMIQLAVGAHHCTYGNRIGCQSQWHKALQKCDALRQMYEADVPDPLVQLTALLDTCLAAVTYGNAPWPHLHTFATSVVSEAWFAFA